MHRCDHCGDWGAQEYEYELGDVFMFCDDTCETHFWGGQVPALARGR